MSLLCQQCCRLRLGKRTPHGGRQVVSPSPTLTRRGFTCPCCVHAGSNDVVFRWLGALQTWSAALTFLRKQRPERPQRTLQNTAMAVVVFGGSQPPRWRWKLDGRNNTIKCYEVLGLMQLMVQVEWLVRCVCVFLFVCTDSNCQMNDLCHSGWCKLLTRSNF